MILRLSARTSTIFYCPIWGLQDRFQAVKGVMPVECLLILPQENNQTTTDFKNESEDLTIEKV